MSAAVATSPLFSMPLELMQRPLLRSPSSCSNISVGGECRTIILRRADIASGAMSLTLSTNHHGMGVRVDQALGAESAGLLCGDVIYHVNGTAVSDPDKAIALTKKQTTLIRLLVAGGTRRMRVPAAHRDKIGITCCNRHDGGHGVLVKQVEPGSAVELEGLRVGDVILAVNGQPARNHAQAMAIVLAHLGEQDSQDIEFTVEIRE